MVCLRIAGSARLPLSFRFASITAAKVLIDPSHANAPNQKAKDSATTSRSASPPTFIQPMAALSVDKLPEGPEWAYEVKLDGYRALLIKNRTEVQLRSLAVTNVTNKLYYLTLFDTHTSAGYTNGQPAMPREWMITVKHNF